MKLTDLIKQPRFSSAAQEAMMNVLVTSSWILQNVAETVEPFGITPAQYNVLRILRGSYPSKLTCGDIRDRLLDRTPDVTRLLNRLERSDLIERERADYDRRVVEVSITDKGLETLSRLQDAVDEMERRLMRHLTPEEHEQLSVLLERLRTDQTA